MVSGKMQKQTGPGDEPPGSPCVFKDALRLPNCNNVPQAGSPRNGGQPNSDGCVSPTSFLTGGAAIDNFKSSATSNFVQYEGEMYRKTPDNKLKRYWFCLLGKELYCYKKKEDEKHKDMHVLVGTFIKTEPEDKLDEKMTIYPFKLIFP